MQQALHLLIIDCDRATALATRQVDRWLLPIVYAPDEVRAGPLALAWMTERGIDGDVFGQWLGRPSQWGRIDVPSVDWLVVIRAQSPHAHVVRHLEKSRAGLAWMRLARLRQSRSWLSYQQWAVQKAMAATLPQVPGPFGSASWLDEVKAWTRCDRIVPLRVSPYEIVLECQSTEGRMYFKGLSADRAVESTITSRLFETAPESFPRTVAQRTRPDGTVWWLMHKCPGHSLADRLTPQHVSDVVEHYVQLQKKVLLATAGIASPGETAGPLSSLPDIDLDSLADWGCDLVSECEGAAPFCDVIRAACATAAGRDVPRTFIASDLDPSNVLIDGDHVRFIDLDGAAFAPAPIALPTFGRRLKQLGPRLYELYERAWGCLPRMNDRWRAFEIVSLLLECHQSWCRVSTKTARGEIYDLEEVARQRMRTRVTRALVALQSRV